MSELQRFWVRFERLPRPSAINLGVGVTAFDADDAIALIAGDVFKRGHQPALIEIAAIDDASHLDAHHVRPNVGNLDVRGVWFPQGYEHGATAPLTPAAAPAPAARP